MKFNNQFLRRLVGTSALALILSYADSGTARADVGAVGDTSPAAATINTTFDAGGDIGGDLIVGDTGVGGLFMDAAPPLFGTLAPLEMENGIIGNLEGSIGAVTLDDFGGGDFIVNVDFIVGSDGQAFLDIFDSASVTVTGRTTFGELEQGTGVATINGQGSRIITNELVVGDLGYGQLDLTQRAILVTGTVGGASVIGNDFGGVGIVALTDIGTRWTVGTITNPASLFIGNGVLGNTTAQGTLKIANQALVQVSDVVAIGNFGRLELETEGRLRILPSSQVNALLDVITNTGVIMGDGYIDFTGDGTATDPHVLLNGVLGEIRNAANAIEGTFGANQREKLIFTGDLFNGDVLLNFGLIESLGGEMEFRVPVDNVNNILARDAVLRFEDGLIGTTGTGDLILSGTTTVHGQLSGNAISVLPGSVTTVVGGIRFSSPLMAFTDGEVSDGEVSAPLLASPGFSLAIGENPGTLTVIGDLDLTGGLLDLDVTTLGVPQAGDIFEVVTIPGGAGMFGMFDNTTVSAGGYLWGISYDPDSVFVSYAGLAAGPMGADFNGDGTVNGLDIAIWQANFGRTSPPNLDAFGDADSDGDVDGRDFLRIQREFGGSGVEPIVAELASVPEPSALVLLLSAAVGGFARRKKIG